MAKQTPSTFARSAILVCLLSSPSSLTLLRSGRVETSEQGSTWRQLPLRIRLGLWRGLHLEKEKNKHTRGHSVQCGRKRLQMGMVMTLRLSARETRSPGNPESTLCETRRVYSFTLFYIKYFIKKCHRYSWWVTKIKIQEEVKERETEWGNISKRTTRSVKMWWPNQIKKTASERESNHNSTSSWDFWQMPSCLTGRFA